MDLCASQVDPSGLVDAKSMQPLFIFCDLLPRWYTRYGYQRWFHFYIIKKLDLKKLYIIIQHSRIFSSIWHACLCRIGNHQLLEKKWLLHIWLASDCWRLSHFKPPCSLFGHWRFMTVVTGLPGRHWLLKRKKLKLTHLKPVILVVMHNKVSLPLCGRDKFADKSTSSMKIKVDHVNLLASKEITRFLVQHPLCNQFQLWGTCNLQQSLTNQPWRLPGGHRSVGLCDWGLAEESLPYLWHNVITMNPSQSQLQ